MHGFEYALAGLMISEGMTAEGMAIVTAVRDRYRGYNRNPFNEIECGNNYARSMASFALLPIFSGFFFHMPEKQIGFDPLLPGDFRAPWFLDCAWGAYERREGETSLTVFDGALALRTLTLPYLSSVRSVTAASSAFLFSSPIVFEGAAVSTHRIGRTSLRIAFTSQKTYLFYMKKTRSSRGISHGAAHALRRGNRH